MQEVQQRNSRISKQTIFRIIVVLYIVLSAAFILLTQFQAYQTRLVQEAYLEGRIVTIEELIDEAEGGCQPFPIYVEDRQVELINVTCLLPVGESATSELIPAEPGGE